jgi:hypothetical protein
MFLDTVSAGPDAAALASPLFDPLRPFDLAALVRAPPDCTGLQRLLERRGGALTSGGGARLRFVPQRGRRARFERGYESRIFLGGEVQVRTGSLHDLMNALAWLRFPAAKAALNAAQYRALRERRARVAAGRGAAGDALTLFDESGVAMVYSDETLPALVRAFRWKALFWDCRARLAAAARFVVFGHALYEKALRPYVGLTGHALLLPVEPAFFALPAEIQLERVDALLAARLGGTPGLASTRELSPLPVLGVPGWWPDAGREDFYDDRRYFRPARGTVSPRR